MVPDTNWRIKMLNKLYKRLHAIFIISIMLIITLIIAIISINYLSVENVNDSFLFQRMSMLLIYQLEDSEEGFKSDVKDYEKKYSIFSLLEDANGNVIYQSNMSLPTNSQTVLNRLKEQINTQQSTNLNVQTSTVQVGIFEIEGTSDDKYWGIPAKVFSKNGNVYSLLLIYPQKTVTELLQRQIPFYVLIWLSAFLGIIIISRILLKKAFDPTERILKSQKEFVASASHELKSPLAVILSNAEIVERISINDTQIQKSIKTIDAECIRMSNLIKDMLLLASSDAKTWTLHKEDVNVDTLLITLYETFEPVCEKQGLSLKLELSEQIYPVLYTDKERLLQILSIFMDNAICYSKHDSSIQIQTSFTTKDITFFIVDHGAGINDEDKPFIFNRFYCADKSRTDKSHFGLGLSIAEELAKMANAKVGFKDTNGGGATFFLTFQIK